MRILVLLGIALFAVMGCAKFPASVGADTTRVIFRMTVRGQIRSDYVYVFPIRVSVDPNPVGDGPIPTIQFPTANGFVQGHVDYFVLWSPDTTQYTLYKFTDSTLTFYNAVGNPINTLDVTTGSKTLGFEIGRAHV